MGSIRDDSRLHAARSYTSSPDSPFSLISSFTQSTHLFFGLPLLLLPCISIPITLFPTYSSSLLITCPYHRILHSWTFFEIVLPLIFSFLILSLLVTPHIHRNILIYTTSIFFSCAFFTFHVSAPFTIAGLTIILYINLSLDLDFHSSVTQHSRHVLPVPPPALNSMVDFCVKFSILHQCRSQMDLNVFTLFTSSPSSPITRSYCSLLFQYSVFFLLLFSPRSSIAFIHSSSFLPASSLLMLHSTMSSANSMPCTRAAVPWCLDPVHP